MADKKYQVFISSTFVDLKEERRKILDVLLMADCIPAGMELFVATDNDQFEVIKKVIDLCDYYILIIGKCYGSVDQKTGLSYTEMEYNYAKEQEIPVLVFAIDDTVEVSDEKKEHDVGKIELLKQFRRSALSNRLASIWKDTEELVGKCSISIMRAKTEIERTGWQRATDYDEASLRREIMALQNENENLQNNLLKANEEILSFTEQKDVAFENCVYKLDYHYYNGTSRKNCSKTITLDEIFIPIALKMNDVSINVYSISFALGDFLCQDGYDFALEDKEIINRILIQLKALGFLYSIWSDKKSQLFWGLTQKGIKTRDDLILIKNR